MNFVTHTGLAEALRAVLGARDSRHLTREWAIVLAALKHQARMRGAGDLAGDVVQTAALRILRARTPFEGREDGRAFKYLGTLVRRATLDRVDRTRRRDPLDHIASPAGDDERDPIDRVPAPDSDPARSIVASTAWKQLVDRLLGYVDETIEAADLTPAKRESAWLHANATVLAILGKQGAREIARTLDVPEASDAAIYKWTERGRAWIERALDRWRNQTMDDEMDAPVVAELSAQLLRRRKDAGRDRPQRRRKGRAKP